VDRVLGSAVCNRVLVESLVPLNAWARLQLELCGDPRTSGGRWAQAVQRVSVVRTDTLRLLPSSEQEELLWCVGDATAKLINVENFRRRKLFFERKSIDCCPTPSLGKWTGLY